MLLNAPTIAAYITGTPDYPFDVSYVGITKRNGTQSYYSISAPFTQELVDAFVARPAGLVYITANGATLDFFNIDEYEYSLGPYSSSFTVSGYRQETFTTPATIIIDPKYVTNQISDSDNRVTLSLIPFIYPVRPGDTIAYGDLSKTLIYVSLEMSSGVYNQNLVLGV
jgi:hypothetical protein